MRLEALRKRWIGNGNQCLQSRSSSVDSTDDDIKFRLDDPSLRLTIADSPTSHDHPFGDFSTAVSHYEQALKKNYFNFMTTCYIAEALRDDHKLNEALEQVNNALKLKDIKQDLLKQPTVENFYLQNVESKKTTLVVPKTYLVLQDFKKLEGKIENLSQYQSEIKTNLLDNIKKSIAFQLGKFSTIQDIFIPSFDKSSQIHSGIQIPNDLLEDKDIRFIHGIDIKKINLPNDKLWENFDKNTTQIQLPNPDIKFYGQKGNYCGIAALKNYFQLNSFSELTNILSKKYGVVKRYYSFKYYNFNYF